MHFIGLLFCLFSTLASAHSGGLDADGCHTARKTGEYHCHKKNLATKQPVNEKLSGFTFGTVSHQVGQVLQIDYEGFTIWLDCGRRGPSKFRYIAQRDTGNNKRLSDFLFDPNIPKICQQKSTKPYGFGYDRGHQVPANHLDSSPTAIRSTNFMTNILPQAANMNRGAWLLTEEIIECYRDIDELLVIGGTIWGDNAEDDYFIGSHGVVTPDAFWKVIIRGSGQDERVIAWIVPNNQEATKRNLDLYLVSIDQLEKTIGETLPVAEYAKHEKPKQSWMIPRGCNKS